MREILIAIFAASVLAGCASIPSFDPPIGSKPGPDGKGPTIPQLVTHIQCEIWDLLTDTSGELSELKGHAYVVTANLTLDVTNNESFSPTINVITPLNPATTNRTTILGGQLSGTQHRSVNLSFALLLDPSVTNREVEREEVCKKQLKSDGGLQGKLDLKEVVVSGLQSVKGFLFGSPTSAQAPKTASTIPSFGSTIDFTIVGSVGGGPTWNLTRFKGPSGSGNLLNYMRTNKDTLVIAFAQAGAVDPNKSSPEQIFMLRRPESVTGTIDAEQAARAAQDNVTRMILQRLIPQ